MTSSIKNKKEYQGEKLSNFNMNRATWSKQNLNHFYKNSGDSYTRNFDREFNPNFKINYNKNAVKHSNYYSKQKNSNITISNRNKFNQNNWNKDRKYSYKKPLTRRLDQLNKKLNSTKYRKLLFVKTTKNRRMSLYKYGIKPIIKTIPTYFEINKYTGTAYLIRKFHSYEIPYPLFNFFVENSNENNEDKFENTQEQIISLKKQKKNNVIIAHNKLNKKKEIINKKIIKK